jgi:hypothetical protein
VVANAAGFIKVAQVVQPCKNVSLSEITSWSKKAISPDYDFNPNRVMKHHRKACHKQFFLLKNIKEKIYFSFRLRKASAT